MNPNISLGCCGSHPTVCSSVGFSPLPTLLWVTKDRNLYFLGSLPSGFWLDSIKMALAGEGQNALYFSPCCSSLSSVSSSGCLFSLAQLSRKVLISGLCLHHLFHLSFQHHTDLTALNSDAVLHGWISEVEFRIHIHPSCKRAWGRDDTNFLLLLISGLPSHLLFSSLFLQYLSKCFQY